MICNTLIFLQLLLVFTLYFKERGLLIFVVLVEGINDFQSCSGSNGKGLHSLKKDHYYYSSELFTKGGFATEIRHEDFSEINGVVSKHK